MENKLLEAENVYELALNNDKILDQVRCLDYAKRTKQLHLTPFSDGYHTLHAYWKRSRTTKTT